ncbi:hypothetical protein H0A36_02665 [Endozoicomonas sp. SM1973]|uniref:Uncharacterized protein n=1 Tax=Spartinivicinus marinus TaxID=2994442 RepID=A0A853HUE8_9GAMM|nr:hypothetical protein [Spartinivicinus marinus]MCX4029864.1 hypothetical protein [Spartinivicinus marinus]NYZ64893.1 hypothetical protein [Spartinivicinus marinus]
MTLLRPLRKLRFGMSKPIVACLFLISINGLAETISVAVADWPPHYYKEKPTFFYYTAPNLYDPYVFFHLVDTPFSWESLDQLKEWEPIGVTAGYDYGKNFNKEPR